MIDSFAGAAIITFAAFIVVIGAWLLRKEAQAPVVVKPPDPPEFALRLDVQELRKRVEQLHGLTTEEAQAMGRQLDRIERRVDAVCERLDADARLATAIARMGRIGE